MTAPLLLLAHGAGSSAEFLARAFPATAVRTTVRYLQDRSGAPARIADALTAAAARSGDGPVVVGGVSVGAHGAALAAGRLGSRCAGLLAVLPARIGHEPAPALAYAAEEVARDGPAGVLARLAADPVAARDWVTAELLAAWPDRPTLVAELRAAAAAPGPARCELAALTMPSCVLALRDDPLHPLEVARAWAAALPSAQLVELPRQAPAADRSVFGAAVAAWLAGLPGR